MFHKKTKRMQIEKEIVAIVLFLKMFFSVILNLNISMRKIDKTVKGLMRHVTFIRLANVKKERLAYKSLFFSDPVNLKKNHQPISVNPSADGSGRKLLV
jgi:hypothetical protein